MKCTTTATATLTLLVASAAAIPAGVIEAGGGSDRPVVAKDCYCAPIAGACADSCGNPVCWSNCWGGGPWGKAATETDAAAEAE
ncbi:hypothetical protein Micbo1qcDRAFT_200605 [Microdochium bolleyi]|uniref:Uncharacterized protein n=1 Tax=Microdochium bolleyi TaxID=196109 RepID=A0A136JDF8_9PEZI|nr:hypothetical protein Micbo1qcDRAFT_200605 [Microdochium bolleyi]